MIYTDRMQKYEYLSGEDLGYRPDPVQKLNLKTVLWVKCLIKAWIKMKKRRIVEKAKKY